MKTIKYHYEEFLRQLHNPNSHTLQFSLGALIGLVIFCLFTL